MLISTGILVNVVKKTFFVIRQIATFTARNVVGLSTDIPDHKWLY